MIGPKTDHLSFASASAIQEEDLENNCNQNYGVRFRIFLSRNVVNVVLDVTKK